LLPTILFDMQNGVHFGVYKHIKGRDSIRASDVDTFIALLQELPPKQCFFDYHHALYSDLVEIKINITVLENTVCKLQSEVRYQLPVVLGEIVLSYIYQFPDNIISTLKAIEDSLNEQKKTLGQFRSCKQHIEQKLIMQSKNKPCIVHFDDKKMCISTRRQRQDISFQDVDDFINSITELPPKQSFVDFCNQNHCRETLRVTFQKIRKVKRSMSP